jgi:hypothetical protein
MLCEVCNEEEATVTLIPVGEGMPQSIGAACFARFGLEAAKASLPAEEIAAVLGPMFVQPARPEPEPKAAKSKRPAKAEAAPEPVEATGTDGGEVALPSAAADL